MGEFEAPLDGVFKKGGAMSEEKVAIIYLTNDLQFNKPEDAVTGQCDRPLRDHTVNYLIGDDRPSSLKGLGTTLSKMEASGRNFTRDLSLCVLRLTGSERSSV